MELRIRSDSADLVGQLRQWLRVDPRAGELASKLDAGDGDSEHLAAFEVLFVVVNTLISFSSLVVAIADWRASHPKANRPSVTIEYRSVSVFVDDPTHEDIARMYEVLEGEGDGHRPTAANEDPNGDT